MDDPTCAPEAADASIEEVEKHLLHVMVPDALDKAALVIAEGEQTDDAERRRASIYRAHELIGFAVTTVRAVALQGPTDRRQEAFAYAVRVEELSKRLKEVILLQMSIDGPSPR